MSSWMKAMITTAAVTAGIATSTLVHADDVFIKLDGIGGESQDGKHRGEIDATAWSWGVTQQVGSATGAGTGRAQISDITVTKRIDKATPILAQMAASGKHIRSAVLMVRSTQRAEYLRISLDDVLVSSIKLSVDGSKPTETVSFNFAKVRMDYSPQKADGSLEPAVTFSWDVRANKQD